MCKIILENLDEKALIIELNGNKLAITKRCMPKEDFQKLFPEYKFRKYEHIQRKLVLDNQDVLNLVKKKKIGCINCNVRQLA